MSCNNTPTSHNGLHQQPFKKTSTEGHQQMQWSHTSDGSCGQSQLLYRAPATTTSDTTRYIPAHPPHRTTTTRSYERQPGHTALRTTWIVHPTWPPYQRASHRYSHLNSQRYHRGTRWYKWPFASFTNSTDTMVTIWRIIYTTQLGNLCGNPAAPTEVQIDSPAEPNGHTHRHSFTRSRTQLSRNSPAFKTNSKVFLTEIMFITKRKLYFRSSNYVSFKIQCISYPFYYDIFLKCITFQKCNIQYELLWFTLAFLTKLLF